MNLYWVVLPRPLKLHYFGVLWKGAFVDFLTYIKWNISFYTWSLHSEEAGAVPFYLKRILFWWNGKLIWYFDYYMKCSAVSNGKNVITFIISSPVAYCGTIALSIAGFFSSLNLYSSVSSVGAPVSVTERLYCTFPCGGQDSPYWKRPATSECRLLPPCAAFVPFVCCSLCFLGPAALPGCSVLCAQDSD